MELLLTWEKNNREQILQKLTEPKNMSQGLWDPQHAVSPVTCDPDWPWRPSGDQPETRVVNDGTHLRKNKQ